MKLLLSFLLFFAATMRSSAQDIVSVDALIASVRAEYAQSCKTLEFGEGFATARNMNGDGVDDLLVDYHGLLCDESSMMFCGSAGCDMVLYLGKESGGYAELSAFFGYAVDFDMPIANPPSFVVALHGNECGLSGMEPCAFRYAIEGGELIEVGQVPARD